MSKEPGSSVRDRVAYIPIHKRPRLHLPGGARVAVWTIVNVENWSPSGPMPRTVLPPPMGQPLLPDVPNWAWHEYGMRIGFWRFLETLGSRGLKATFALNGTACMALEIRRTGAIERGGGMRPEVVAPQRDGRLDRFAPDRTRRAAGGAARPAQQHERGGKTRHWSGAPPARCPFMSSECALGVLCAYNPVHVVGGDR